MPADDPSNIPPQWNRQPGLSNHSLLKILILFAFVILGTYLFVHFNLHTFFIDRKKAIHFITSFGALSVPVFIAFQILQVLIAPLPGEVTGIIGGYLYGPVLGTIYSTIGLTLGSVLAFILARFLGLPFVEKAVSKKILQKYDYFMEHQGALVTFFMFLIPGFPKDALCYIMGLSHMRMRIFLCVSTAGRLFGTILLSVGGSCVRNNQSGVLYVILGLTAVVLVLAYLFREKILKKLHTRRTTGP